MVKILLINAKRRIDAQIGKDMNGKTTKKPDIEQCDKFIRGDPKGRRTLAGSMSLCPPTLNLLLVPNALRLFIFVLHNRTLTQAFTVHNKLVLIVVKFSVFPNQ